MIHLESTANAPTKPLTPWTTVALDGETLLGFLAFSFLSQPRNARDVRVYEFKRGARKLWEGTRRRFTKLVPLVDSAETMARVGSLTDTNKGPMITSRRHYEMNGDISSSGVGLWRWKRLWIFMTWPVWKRSWRQVTPRINYDYSVEQLSGCSFFPPPPLTWARFSWRVGEYPCETWISSANRSLRG